MNKLDENKALAIIFANIRRKKRIDDLITIANAIDFLENKYGSQKDVAKKVGLSNEMIRQLHAVLGLPPKIQKIFKSRQIDSVDIVKELLAIKDPMEQINFIDVIMNSSSKDVRDIKRLVRIAKIPAQDAKRVILESKPKGMHVFLIDFDDEIYNSIVKYAKDKKVKPAELVREIVKDQLKQKGKFEKKQRSL